MDKFVCVGNHDEYLIEIATHLRIPRDVTVTHCALCGKLFIDTWKLRGEPINPAHHLHHKQ
jgi:hypothetical protein